jgi:nucleoside-diphosphate-sugar epimerase
MSLSKDLALPNGSLILVTGANGHVASNIVYEALNLGYRVRGTVRSEERALQTQKIFSSDSYESIIVKDMSEIGAFDDAVRGVSGIIHVATTTTFDPDPNKVIPNTIAGATGILKSALGEPSVQRVVYTGSIPIGMRANEHYILDSTTWADEAVKAAWAPPPYNLDRGFVVYKASKDLAERAVWDFVKTHKPHFVVNSVLPTAIFGRIISSPSITGEWPLDILKGNMPPGTTPRKSLRLEFFLNLSTQIVEIFGIGLILVRMVC